MGFLLGIDTAGPVVGVALADAAGTCLGLRQARIARADTALLAWADELLTGVGASFGDLIAVGVAEGPGMFTGLRVGMATAAGLAMAVGAPLVGVGSLEARAARVGGRVLALLDARQDRVYAATWHDGPGRSAEDVPVGEAMAWMAPAVATGEGALVYRGVLEAAGWTVAAEAEHSGVDALVRLAADALARGEGRLATDVRPRYVRPPTLGGKRGGVA